MVKDKIRFFSPYEQAAEALMGRINERDVDRWTMDVSAVPVVRSGEGRSERLAPMLTSAKDETIHSNDRDKFRLFFFDGSSF